MKLMTKDLEEKFKRYGDRSQEEKGDDAIVVVKYFDPYGPGTWLITEGTRQPDGDYLFFGLCCITDWEWGYVMLSELERISCIERDLYLSPGTTVADELKALGVR